MNAKGNKTPNHERIHPQRLIDEPSDTPATNEIAAQTGTERQRPEQ